MELNTEGKAEEAFNNLHGSSYSSLIEMNKESLWEEGFCVGYEQANSENTQTYLFDRCRFCEYLHQNGNCTIIGGFYSAVDDKHCPKVREKMDLQKEIIELKEKVKKLEMGNLDDSRGN